MWVLKAFRPFWAFQTGYWSWLAGVIDNAIYPGLAVSSFTILYDFSSFSSSSSLSLYGIKAALAVGLALPNLFGLKLVGTSMAFLSVFVLLPFLVMSFWGLLKAHEWQNLVHIRKETILYQPNGEIELVGAISVSKKPNLRLPH